MVLKLAIAVTKQTKQMFYPVKFRQVSKLLYEQAMPDMVLLVVRSVLAAHDMALFSTRKAPERSEHLQQI